MNTDSIFGVRTKESLDKAVRSWVNDLGHLTICGGKKYGEPYLYLEMEHTLFCPSSDSGEDNRELYALNQPLLEKALKSWENKLKAEIKPEGLPGIYKYGFLPED